MVVPADISPADRSPESQGTPFDDCAQRATPDLGGRHSRPPAELLQELKLSAVSAGVATGLSAHLEWAGGAIVAVVDGNHQIDVGSGNAVTTVGNSAGAHDRTPSPLQ